MKTVQRIDDDFRHGVIGQIAHVGGFCTEYGGVNRSIESITARIYGAGIRIVVDDIVTEPQKSYEYSPFL